MMRPITTDETCPVESRNGVMRIHPSLMAFGTCYSVEHEDKMYQVRKNQYGTIHLSEEV